MRESRLESPPPNRLGGVGSVVSSPAGSGASPGCQRFFGIFEVHRTLLVERTVSIKPFFCKQNQLNRLLGACPPCSSPSEYVPVSSCPRLNHALNLPFSFEIAAVRLYARVCQLYVTLVSLAVFIIPTIIISVCYVIIISVICRKAALLRQEPIVHWTASNSSQRLSRSTSPARRYPLRYGMLTSSFCEMGQHQNMKLTSWSFSPVSSPFLPHFLQLSPLSIFLLKGGWLVVLFPSPRPYSGTHCRMDVQSSPSLPVFRQRLNKFLFH